MPSIEALREEVMRLDRATNAEWYAGLEERKRRESEFHDNMRDRKRLSNPSSDTYEEFFSNHRFYRTARASRDYFYGWIERSVRDRVVIDLACGDGHTTIRAAQAGAKLVVGIDISNGSVQNARNNAAAARVTGNTVFLRGDGEATGLPDGCADVIICAGVLHHLDLRFAYPEMARLLGPAGRAIALEALDYNPLIKLYRARTPNLRTEWERGHILSLKEVEFARKFFDVGEVRFFHMTSMLGVWAPWALPVLNAMDAVATRVPGLRLWSWMFTFELLSRKAY
jgi:SAM-dependent methyltransferase